MRFLCVLVCSAVLLSLILQGDAVCCTTHGYKQGKWGIKPKMRCDDCEKGTPYCGIGRCNAFGCDCEMGCRRGPCAGETVENPYNYRPTG